jgi:hypothetical protein
MKLILVAVCIVVFGIVTHQYAYAEAVVQKVCHDTVVKGKLVQQCKTIKVHRKFEGTPVPEAPVKKTRK